MAHYAAPKSLGSIFNNETYNFANTNSVLNNLASTFSSTNTETVSQAINIVSNGDTLISLSDGLIKQISDDLVVTTEDGYTLSLNKDKQTAGDLLINENSYHSNVIIANGNLTLKNGYLNLGKTGTLVLNGADINAVLVNNQFQLRVQADTLVNHDQTLNVHSTGIAESVDIGVTNSTKIVQIEQAYAPLDAPVFTTSLALPPLVVVDNTNVSSTQISYLSNLTGDVQTGLNTINSTIGIVQAKQVIDASNIQVLQTNLATVTSKQLTDESNISTLQSSVATINTKLVTDESNISSLQSSVATIITKQTTDESNISDLQSSVATINTKLVTDESNISSLQSSVAMINTKLVTDESNISSLQSSVATISTKQVTDESNISVLQSSLATVASKQTTDKSKISAIQSALVTDEGNIATLQNTIITKAPLVSPIFSGTQQVPTASPNTNNTVIASTQYVDVAISSLIGTSPSLLNTLQEIDAAINNDPNFSTTVTNQIALKANTNNPSFTTGISTPAISLNGTDLQTSLNTFAKLNNPSFTGTVTLPSTVDNGSLTCNNGLTVSSGSVYFPLNSVSTASINNNGYFALASSLSSYLLSATATATYATISSLSNYVTSSALATTLSSYVTSSSLTTTLSSYALSSALSSYALVSSLSAYVTNSSLTSTLSSYVTSSSLTTTLSSYALSSALSSYLTTSTATSTYATLTSITNPLNGTTSHSGFSNTGVTNLSGLANILELSETVSSVTVSANVATCAYGNGALFYVSSGNTASFTLALTGLTPPANKAYSVTLLINGTNKFYASALTINGTATTTFVYNGGSANVSVTSAIYIIQQFNIVYTASTSVPAFVITSIGQAY